MTSTDRAVAGLDEAVATVRANLAPFATWWPGDTTTNGTYLPRRPADGGGEGENTGWTTSFWTGQVWLAWQLTGDDLFREVGTAHAADFARRMREHVGVDTHDLGFLYTLSSVVPWRLLGDEQGRATALAAADHLMTRFLEPAGIVQAWGGVGRGGPARPHDHRQPDEHAVAVLGDRADGRPSVRAGRATAHRPAARPHGPHGRHDVPHVPLGPGQRRGPARHDGPGPPRRLLLGARPGVGRLRVRDGSSLHRRPVVQGDGRDARRLLPRPPAGRPGVRMGPGLHRRPDAAAGQLGRGDRRQRARSSSPTRWTPTPRRRRPPPATARQPTRSSTRSSPATPPWPESRAPPCSSTPCTTCRRGTASTRAACGATTTTSRRSCAAPDRTG